MRSVPARKRPVSEAGFAIDLVGRAHRHHVAAQLARPGPEVHDVVGGADGLLVVLDHQHRVAEVAQALERVEEPAVVPLVQPDGGLVQDVEDADQARADLGGQADALPLPAGQRGRGAVERQVVEARPAERKPRRSRISFSTRRAMAISRSVSLSVSKNWRAALMGSRTTSAMERPAILTESVSGRSREPSQAGQSR